MTIDINKRSGGSTELPVAECIDKHMDTWRVRTDFQPEYDEEEVQRGVTFIETEYPYKPSMAQVKSFVNAVINAKTREHIISGFDYTILHGDQQGTEVKVWLSEENQSDFHAMHQNADGLTFPVHYKVGELSDATPVYEDFASAEEMHQICVLTASHVLACQQAGWQEKDTFDYAPYEEILG